MATGTTYAISQVRIAMDKKLLLCLLGFVCGLRAQSPVIEAVVNAASNKPQYMPFSGIAPGSIFVLYGENLGPAALVQAGYPLPTTAGLAGTTISVSMNGKSSATPILYSSQNQVAAILPSSTLAGDGTLTITYGGQAATAPIHVTSSAFGIFAINQGGYGPAAATLSDGSVVGIYHPVAPGKFLTLWGTGLGATTGDDSLPPEPTDLGTAVQVLVAGQPAEVTYRGRSGCCAGLDQINFVMPAVEGCAVPVSVQIGSSASNYVTIAVSSGQVCTQPFQPQYGSAFLSELLTGARVASSLFIERVANFGGPSPQSYDHVDMNFFRVTAADQERRLLAGSAAMPPIGSCTAGPFRLTSAPTGLSPALINPQGLDAGSSLQVAGPAGNSTLTLVPNIPQVSLGAYSGLYTGAEPEGFFGTGSVTVAGNGGADVGSFSLNSFTPPALTWTNIDSVTSVHRDQPLTVTWTGGDPEGYVEIDGLSYVTGSAGGTFSCYAATSAGQFTIPASLLSILPSSSSGKPGGTLVSLSGFSAVANFLAPGINLGSRQTVTVMINRSVSFQ